MTWNMYGDRELEYMAHAEDSDRLAGVAKCDCVLPRYYFPRAGWHVRIVNSAWLAWFRGGLRDDTRDRWGNFFKGGNMTPESAARKLEKHDHDDVMAALERFAYADKFIELHYWKRCPCEQARLSLERIEESA